MDESQRKTAFDEISQALQKAGIDTLDNGDGTLTAYCANGTAVRLTLDYV